MPASTCCVIDNGLFVEFARKLTEFFPRVLYHTPWKNAFPTSLGRLIGEGTGVIRVNELFDVLGENVDLYIFPDVYWADLQVFLEQRGEHVVGARKAEELELDRVGGGELLRSLGISVPRRFVVRGTAALRETLRRDKDVWVKISRTRGDMETFFVKTFELVEPMIDEMEYRLGKRKDVVEFVVEEDIPDAVEVGVDTFTVDGQFPAVVPVGVEAKDKGYVCKVMPFDSLPPQLKDPLHLLRGFLAEKHCRCWFSLETRICSDGTYAVIDPCVRLGSPPFEGMTELVTNWGEVLVESSKGVLKDPEYSHTYMAILMLHSLWADKNWMPVRVPEEYRRFVKLRNLTVIDGVDYVVPQGYGLPEIGAAIGLGDTADEAVNKAIRVAESVEGCVIDFFADHLYKAMEELHGVCGGS